MAQFPIGKVIPNYCGRYKKESSYEELDIVAHNNGTWVSMTNNNTTEPSEDNTKWRILLESPISQADVNNLNNIFLPMITDKLEEISKKIEENKKDIFEMTTLTRDSINGSAIARSKIQEVTQRLSKIEKKLGI